MIGNGLGSRFSSIADTKARTPMTAKMPTSPSASMLENVLVIFKKSLYQIYFQEKRLPANHHNQFSAGDLARFKAAHDTHQGTLETICATLTAEGITYRTVYRARQVDYSSYTMVISVGGDGTFIEASRCITDQPILGVNSDPNHSVGNFCSTNSATFQTCLRNIANGKASIQKFNRLDIAINGEAYPYRALNEILLAHQSPAAMSRYRLTIGEQSEVQRSSGIWVSTAAGSTGAIRSAGGRIMKPGSNRLQYRPRELFSSPKDGHYDLRGSILSANQSIVLESMMREGMVYIDGPHLRIALPFGNTMALSRSSQPLRVIHDAPADR